MVFVVAARRAARFTLRVAHYGAVCAIVASCASVPAGTFDRTLRGETIEGRLSIRYTDLDTGKGDASSGRFVWTASGDQLELSLLDPLGQTIALVRSDAARSSITYRDGRRVEGDSPEALTENTLGWTVPLRGLRYWLNGRADPARPSSTDADGALRQDRWTIRFQRDDGSAMPPVTGAGAVASTQPKRIDLAYPGPPAEIAMRLIVDQRTASP